MSCEHCVGADLIFNDKEVLKTLKNYQKKGPRKTTKKLIEGLSKFKNGASTLLEIGGGIGAVQIELMKEGISQVTNVDASSAYIEIAKNEAKRNGYEENVRHLFGDFMDHKNDIDKHDIVVLDKVVCCYPHMTELLEESISKSNEVIGLVYPKSNIAGKLIIGMGNLYMYFIKKTAFRAYMHSNQEIRDLINQKGYERMYYKTVYPWNIEVYTKSSH